MKNKGMAIPLVLGFILVTTILGTSLLFLSRTRGSESHKNIGRLQIIHVSQMGLQKALAAIKPLRMTEYMSQRGQEWKFKTSQMQYGRAVSWCEVTVKTRGINELEIESIGHWLEKGAPARKSAIACRARYKEIISKESAGRFSTITKIEGEWKIENFVEKTVD